MQGKRRMPLQKIYICYGMLYISKVVWGLQKMCGCKIFFAQKKRQVGC